MGGAGQRFLRAFGLGAVSYLALTAGWMEQAGAQSLPPITVEPPRVRAPSRAVTPQARATPVRRAVSRRAATPARVATRSLVRAAPAPAPVTPLASSPPESAYGPVGGYVASRSATASKTDARLVETPQSISVVTKEQIETQAATTVSESLQYTAGVMTGQAGLQSRRFDPIFIRGFGGFSADANYASYLDGLKWNFPARTAIQIDPWMVERVEVFKGPSSVLYGRANLGGFVNLVSKRPSEIEGGEVFVRAGSYGRLEGGFDVTGPVASDPRFLYRLVGLGRMSDSQIDFQEEQRQLIAPSFTFAPSPDTKLTLQGMYQRDPKAIDAGFLPVVGTVLPSGFGRLPTNRFQGDPNWNLYDRTQQSIGYQLEHRFSEMFTFRQGLRLGNLQNDFRGVDFAALQPNRMLLNRSVGQHLHNVDSFSVDNQLQARFRTGFVNHTMTFGLDYQSMDSMWRIGFGSIGPLNLYAPVYGQPFVRPNPLTRRHDQLRQLGLYVQDQIEFGNFRLWLSGRKDFATISSGTFSTPLNRYVGFARSDDEAFTGRAGLLYLFDNGIAPYASYSTSFEPTAGADIAGNAFKPTTGRQYEVGVKYEPLGWNTLVTVSAFDLTRQNVLTADPLNPLNAIQNGEVRSRGLEFEAKVNLAQGLNLIGTYTYTDVEVTKSTNTVSLIDGSGIVGVQGKVPVAVPRNMASVWAHYLESRGPLAGASLGAGIRYIGQTYGTDTNIWNLPGFVRTPSRVPDFAVVDAVVGYDFGFSIPALKGLSAAVNVRNLFDKGYVAACNGFGSCAYGERRTVLGTLRYRW